MPKRHGECNGTPYSIHDRKPAITVMKFITEGRREFITDHKYHRRNHDPPWTPCAV